MTEAILQLKKLVDESDNIVFFGGAGVSTESGIKDFRSVDGLYHQKFKYPPETMLSHSFYESHMEEFYDFYRTKMLALNAQPNAAHKKLAQWEREGKLKAVITQNIDGLHQKAGSHEVLELHGSVLRNYCRRCGQSVMTIRHRHSTGMRCCSMKVEIKLFNACNTADNGEGFVCVQQIPPLLYMHFQKTTIGVGVYFTLC